MKNSAHVKGLIFVIIGAALWGIGGTASDYIFTETPVDVNWYVTARLTISGIILLSIYTLFFRRKHRLGKLVSMHSNIHLITPILFHKQTLLVFLH